jgi:hypothetical protein
LARASARWVIIAAVGIPVVNVAAVEVATVDWALIDAYYRREYCVGFTVSYDHPRTPHPYRYKHGFCK